MREVVAAREHVVVRDHDLRVHEVVDIVAVAVGRRVLSGEAAVAEDAGDEREFPGRVPVQLPLMEDAAHLRPVADAGDVDLPVGHALGEGAEDRARREHGRADTDAMPGPLHSVGDAGRKRLAVPGREPDSDLPPADVDRGRVDEAALLHRSGRPELLEVLRVGGGHRLGRDDDDDVLAPRPGVVGPVRRARPDRLPVADGELVVHQVRDARNPLRRNLEAVDEARLAARRREHRGRLLTVEVEREPHGDAPLLCLDDSVGDNLRGRLQKVEVVQREVKAAAGLGEERRETVRDLGRRLATVGEEVRLDHQRDVSGSLRSPHGEGRGAKVPAQE